MHPKSFLPSGEKVRMRGRPQADHAGSLQSMDALSGAA